MVAPILLALIPELVPVAEDLIAEAYAAEVKLLAKVSASHPLFAPFLDDFAKLSAKVESSLLNQAVAKITPAAEAHAAVVSDAPVDSNQ